MKAIQKFIAWILLVCVIFILTLSGCKSPVQKSGEDKENTDPYPSNEKVVIKFSYWGSVDEKEVIERACRKFSENYPWITVDPIQVPNSDYNRIMVTMAAGNNLPDTGYMASDLGEIWAMEGRFKNLFDIFAEDNEIKKEDFLDYIWYKLSPDNAWGISTAGECFGLYYNKDLLKIAGVDSLPSRAEEAMEWDRFVELARKLTIDKNGRNALEPAFDPENIKQYGVMFETWSDPLNSFIYSNGGKWITEDGKKFALNSPESAEAIQKLADLINVHRVAPSPLAIKSLPAMSIALQSKLVAMVVGGQWINLDLGNAGVNYDIGVLPRFKKSITVALSGATVFFKSSKHLEEAWMLFKWMSNPDEAIELYSSGLWMPTMKKWYTDPSLVAKWVDANPAAHPAGFKDAMLKQLINHSIPTPRYYLKNQARIEPMVVSSLEPVWMGKMTAVEALKEIEKMVQPEIKGRYDIPLK